MLERILLPYMVYIKLMYKINVITCGENMYAYVIQTRIIIMEKHQTEAISRIKYILKGGGGKKILRYKKPNLAHSQNLEKQNWTHFAKMRN